jgi:DUF1365 family protein
MTAALHSALYEGNVRHRRHAERQGEFRYPVSLAYLDLAELGEVLDGRLLDPRPGLLRFRRRDYLGDPGVSLDESVRALIHEHLGREATGPIRLLTQPRTLGYAFNPVSFYYVFDDGRDGEQLDAVVAEVTNTPWGERHAYVLDAHADDCGPRVVRGRSEKALHVSPFMGMHQHYRWNATVPGTTLSVHIENVEHEQLIFDATLSLRRIALSRRNVARAALRLPGGAVRVLTLIYGHSLALKLRGVPVHRHPAAPASEGGST